MMNMNEKMMDGIAMLSALGSIIDDEGYHNHGNIYIERMTEEKFRLVQTLLHYMELKQVEDYYEMVYDSEMYKEQKPPFPEHIYNQYVIAMIV